MPRPARAAGDASLKAVFDHIVATPDPERRVAVLAAFDAHGLSRRQALAYRAVKAGLAVDVRMARRWPTVRPGDSPYRVSPRAGSWRKAGTDAAPDAAVIDAETQALAADAAQGIILPIAMLRETRRQVLSAAATSAIDRAEAWRRQAEQLRTLEAVAPKTAGLGRIAGGQEYFGLLLHRALGECIKPATAHARAETAVAALATRAEILFARLGMRDGSIGTRFRALARQSKYLYPDSEVGRDALVADMNRWLRRARRYLPSFVLTAPPAVDHVSTLRMSPADEAAGRGGYRTVPPADGSSDGGYYVDLSHIRQRPCWTLPSVVHHELLPGHMLQLPLQSAADPHPLRLEYAGAFVEGWAIHAERLMADAGVFDDDPAAELGYIQWALFRAGRALVDTGIHWRGWTHAQAIARLRDLQGEGVIFAALDEDVARICLEPGIRSAEFLMADALADLRRRARDERTMHSTILAPGAMPLDCVRMLASGV